MSDEAKEILNTIKNGNLPPLNTPPSNSPTSGLGIEISQRGLDRTTFGLQTFNESTINSKKGE